MFSTVLEYYNHLHLAIVLGWEYLNIAFKDRMTSGALFSAAPKSMVASRHPRYYSPILPQFHGEMIILRLWSFLLSFYLLFSVELNYEQS